MMNSSTSTLAEILAAVQTLLPQCSTVCVSVGDVKVEVSSLVQAPAGYVPSIDSGDEPEEELPPDVLATLSGRGY